MALVIAFVPDPYKGCGRDDARGAARKAGVCRHVGSAGRGGPYHRVFKAMEAFGLPTATPPSAEVSGMARRQDLWRDAGLEDVQSKVITAEHAYADFDTMWEITLIGPRLADVSTRMSPAMRKEIKSLAHIDQLVPSPQCWRRSAFPWVYRIADIESDETE